MINTATTFPQILFFPLRELKINLFQDDTSNSESIKQDQTINLWSRQSKDSTLWYLHLLMKVAVWWDHESLSLILNVGVVKNHVSFCLKASRNGYPLITTSEIENLATGRVVKKQHSMHRRADRIDALISSCQSLKTVKWEWGIYSSVLRHPTHFV